MKVINQYGVEFDVTRIPDCWHVYIRLLKSGKEEDAEMVLQCWNQAHAMRNQLRDDIKKARTWGEMDSDETLDFIVEVAERDRGTSHEIDLDLAKRSSLDELI